jgi:O-antigen ligase
MQGLFWPLILSLLFSACLFATSSRGAVVAAGAAVAFTVLGFTFVGTSQRSATGGVTAAIAFVVLAALVLFMIGGNQVMERFGSENPLTNERVALFGGYWRSFLASPWWGYGLGAFDSFNFQSMTAPDAFTMGQMGAAHNVYLQWLLQTGLLGFVPMMTCIIWVLATIVRGLRRRASQQALLIFSLAATCVFAVHGTADFALEEPAMAALFAAILGLGYGVATRP